MKGIYFILFAIDLEMSFPYLLKPHLYYLYIIYPNITHYPSAISTPVNTIDRTDMTAKGTFFESHLLELMNKCQ